MPDLSARLRVFVLGAATPLEVVTPCDDRDEILFSADGTCFLLSGPTDATLTTGLPLLVGSPLVVRGSLARQRWTAISAGTPVLGLVEYYPHAF